MGNILGNDSGRQPRIFEPYGKEDLKADLSVARARLKKVRRYMHDSAKIHELETLINEIGREIDHIDPKYMFAVIDGTTYDGPDDIKQQLMKELFKKLRIIEEELRIMLANQEINPWEKQLVWDYEKKHSIESWVNTAKSEYLPTDEMRRWIKEILNIPTDRIENPAVKEMMLEEDKEENRRVIQVEMEQGGLVGE